MSERRYLEMMDKFPGRYYKSRLSPPPHTHPQPRLLSIMTSIAAVEDSRLIVVYYGQTAAT